MKKLLIFVVLLAIYIGYQMIDHFDPESVKGKTVIITGASSGIGEQLAHQYARLGANIVITARRENRLKEVVANCKTEGMKGGQYHYISLDMAKKDSGQKLIEFAKQKLGRIDTLVLNHAMIKFGKWLGTPDNYTTFYKTVDVNFHAYVSTAAEAIPALQESNGSIIVMSSAGGIISMPIALGYGTAQHAVEGFFGGLREEFVMSNTNISITTCYMGFIGTENSIQQMERLFPNWTKDYIKMSSPEDTALEILKAGAQRLERLFYPWTETRLLPIMDAIFPGLPAAAIRKILA